MATNLLLLSNSSNFGMGYLEHAAGEMEAFLRGVSNLAFVPFALRDQAAYGAIASRRFKEMGIAVETIREDGSATAAVERAEAIFVGGGNTFRLLLALQRAGLVDPIRRRAREGMPYIGSSAGTVIAAPTIRTTNDMPIVEPEGLAALALVPFQINCHYLDPDPASRHMGETRETRIREFLEENEAPVVGLREGAILLVTDTRILLKGTAGARVFSRGRDPEEHATGADLGYLCGS
jgi:dipeptidase E